MDIAKQIQQANLVYNQLLKELGGAQDNVQRLIHLVENKRLEIKELTGTGRSTSLNAQGVSSAKPTTHK